MLPQLKLIVRNRVVDTVKLEGLVVFKSSKLVALTGCLNSL